MMKLSLMRDIFETVNSDWDCSIAMDLASPWNIDKNWIKLWRASANTICFARLKEEKYVFRFNQTTEKSIEDWKSEVRLLKALRSEGLRVSEPVPAIDGSFVQTGETESGSFLSVLYKKVSGDQYDIEDLNHQMFFQWGAALGELHKACSKIQKSTDLERKSHRVILDELFASNPPTNENEANEYAWAVSWLDSLPSNPDDIGLIHYDFELDNLIWDDEGIQIIDFDDAISSWYVADIAYALRDLFDEGSDINLINESFQHFIKGYRSHRKLDNSLFDFLPGFYRLSNLIHLKKFEHSIDIGISEKHPQWLNDLIIKLNDKKNECSNRLNSFSFD